MHELHGFAVLRQEEGQPESAEFYANIEKLRALIAPLAEWRRIAEIKPMNGDFYLQLASRSNRVGSEAEIVDRAIEFISKRLLGSYGLIYDRSGDGDLPPGNNAFRVRRIARGVVTEFDDPFLSPCEPVIEDEDEDEYQHD